MKKTRILIIACIVSLLWALFMTVYANIQTAYAMEHQTRAEEFVQEALRQKDLAEDMSSQARRMEAEALRQQAIAEEQRNEVIKQMEIRITEVNELKSQLAACK